MKTLEQLFSTILECDEISLDIATTRFSRVKQITKDMPNVIKMLELTKFIQSNAYGSTVSEEICSYLDDIIDNTEEEMDNYRKQAFMDIFTIVGPNKEGSIANINGAQIRIATIYSIEQGIEFRSIRIYTVSESGDQSTILNVEQNDAIGGFPTVTKAPDGAISLFNGASFQTTWDAIHDSVLEVGSTNQCLLDIVRQSQADGKISAQQIKDICDSYPQTETIVAIQDQTRGLSTLNKVSVMGVVGQAVSRGDGSYTEGRDYYTPYEVPGYSTDVIGVVSSFVVATVALILSIVFKAIATIVTVIVQIVSSLFQVFQNNVTLTQGKIVSTSDLPVWNFPVGLWDFSVTDSADKLLLNDTIADFGCAVELNYTGGRADVPISSLIRWVLPTDAADAYKTQLLPLATAPQISSWRDCNIVNPDSTTYNLRFYGTGETDSVYTYPSDMTEYLYYSDNQLATALLRNVELAYATIGGHQNYSEGLYIQAPMLLKDVKSWLDAVDASGAPNDTVKVAMAYGVLKFLETTQYWSDIIANYDNSYALLTWTPFINAAAIVSSAAIQGERNFVSGSDVAQPAVEFPGLSRGALLQALVLTSLTALVVTGTKFAFKKWRKKKAVARLALREKQFSTANKAYSMDPSPANLKLLNKYNNKLGKAWKKAGKAGVSSYNGFATGSSSTFAGDVSNCAASFSYQKDIMQALREIASSINQAQISVSG